MNVLITGAAGNLGSLLAGHLVNGPHRLRLMFHHKDPPSHLRESSNVSVVRADLGNASSLVPACSEIDCVVHFAGVLFKPRPEKFLPLTNTLYTKKLIDASISAGVRKFILISFPHVEGETTPESPAKGILEVFPDAIHSKTRLAAEKYLFEVCRNSDMQPVVFRAGTIYGRGVKLIEAARWLMSKGLSAVWKKPTWVHLLSLPDFLRILEIGIERGDLSGIYNVCDDEPAILQDFFDDLAKHWGYRKPIRLPRFAFFTVAVLCEGFGTIFQTSIPLHQDLIKMGMTSVVADTSRMKKELLNSLMYPSYREGMVLL